MLHFPVQRGLSRAAIVARTFTERLVIGRRRELPVCGWGCRVLGGIREWTHTGGCREGGGSRFHEAFSADPRVIQPVSVTVRWSSSDLKWGGRVSWSCVGDPNVGVGQVPERG